MIEFIKPYFDSEEVRVVLDKKPFSLMSENECRSIFAERFPDGYILMNSGSEAIKAITEYSLKEFRGEFDDPMIAIPDVLCGSVYHAVKPFARINLMDADRSWNCIYDDNSEMAHVILFADLGGKRATPPKRKYKWQVIIEDACQCYDGIAGLRNSANYSVFSFSKGKQMYAGNGGIISFPNIDAGHFATWQEANYPTTLPWQSQLMASQLLKIDEINEKRIQNGKYLIEGLKDLEWLTLPDPKDHSFLKFTMFIHQDRISKDAIIQIPGRTIEIIEFIRHMKKNNVQVEETYIPLHMRFPEQFSDKGYKDFQCDHTWIEAITLPCRPGLTEKELDQIIKSVRSFKESSFNKEVQKVYIEKYSDKNFTPPGGYFQILMDTKLTQVAEVSQQNSSILDIGCGIGHQIAELKKHGFKNISGLDFVEKFTDQLNSTYPGVQTYNDDITNIESIQDDSFDIIYSFSTIYYVHPLEKAMQEIHRILKPNGKAVIEFGNISSLADINAKKIPTGVKSNHVEIKWLQDMLYSTGFDIVKKRCFQIFPLYGYEERDLPFGAILNTVMEEMHGNIMLDEFMSSSPGVSDFAFRQLYVLEKTENNNKKNYPELVIPIDTAMSDYLTGLFSKNYNHLAKSFFMKDSKSDDIINKIICFIRDNPRNPSVVYALMKLHSGEKQQEIAEKFFQHIQKLTCNPLPMKGHKMTQNDINPTVSVVIPTYNQCDMLGKTLLSLAAQTDTDFELIIVNDGSTDKTKEYLDHTELSAFPFNCQVIHQENKRLPVALNTGFNVARGEYLTWVSSDCVCAPMFIEALRKALDKFPDAPMAYSSFFFIDEEGLMKGVVSNPIYNRRTLMFRNDGNASFMYRASAAEKIGQYDVDLEGAEDWDYWIRLSELGSFIYVPEKLYYYRLHPASMQNTKVDIVNNSIVKMMKKVSQVGNKKEFNILEFYPHIEKCEDQKMAIFSALFDFGTCLMTSRLPDIEKATKILIKANEVLPENPYCLVNLVIALIKGNNINHAMEYYERLKFVADTPIMQQVCSVIEKGFAGKLTQDKGFIPIMNLSRNETELFITEMNNILSYSLTSPGSSFSIGAVSPDGKIDGST